ncbi:MAG: DUF4332 domain-containing protein [Pirellulaceae bacterium]|nr:DUF4332 domain-containing protein [Pirellulaceae bacterium]
MLRSLLRLISPTDHLETPPTSEQGIPPEVVDHPATIPMNPRGVHIDANHREWLLSKRLLHLKICSQQRCDQLRHFGIVTAGDLANVDPVKLARDMGAPEKAVQVIKRYRAAIRLAASVPGMMPRDAQLLIRIHRHSVRAIALDSPSALYHDLRRFAVSSKGRRMIRGRRLPSLRKVKNWVTACRTQGTGIQLRSAA